MNRDDNRLLLAACCLGVHLLFAAGVSEAGASGPKTACDLFTMQEITTVLNAAVSIDRDQSGPDDRGGDNCVWATADGRNVMIRVAPQPNKTAALTTYLVETNNAFGGGNPPEEVKGLTDEAKYRPYRGTLKGGVVVARKANTVFVLEGSLPRNVLLDLTKSLLPRL